MKVSKVVQVNDNTGILFEGELSQEEADIVIGLGLAQLLRQGAFPHIMAALEEAAKDEIIVAPGNDTIN